MHLRGVAHFAMKMVEEFAASHPEIKVDRDIVLAGALCHDIGKPYEFDPVNRKRWAEDPSRAGDPCLRHSVYGAHVCLSVGLPEEIAHIALGHSLEGQHIGLSTECYIVRHADHSWWHVAGALGLLKPEDRESLCMRFYDQLSTEEMAGVLNLSEATARQRYSRARLRFRETWRKLFGDEGAYHE